MLKTAIEIQLLLQKWWKKGVKKQKAAFQGYEWGLGLGVDQPDLASPGQDADQLAHSPRIKSGRLG